MPVAIKEKWQRMVNIMSNLLRVPTGFIMKVNGPHIQIFTTNVADTNPYHAGQNFELAGLYCEEVMKSDNLLLIPNALKDPEWDNNPEIPAGFIYYLGYPIHWPKGKMFGTICVQDYENNPHATDNKALLEEFRSVCELDLLMLEQQSEREKLEAEQFRLVFENARDPIVWADPETGIILNCNKATENLLEWSREEIVGRHHAEFHPPKEADRQAAMFESHVSSTGLAEGETVVLTKSGRRVPVWISSSVSQVGEKSIIQSIAHDITDRKKAEQTIEGQLAFERLVSGMSTQFVSLRANEIDLAITQGLARMAEFIGADRAAIVQPKDKDDRYGYSHYWAREGVERALEDAAAAEPYPWLAKQILEEDRIVSFSRLDDLPSEAKGDKKSFEKMGVQSLLCLPLKSGGLSVGAISFTTVQSQRNWPKAVVSRMSLVASLFSHALDRKRAQLALQERLRFQQLVSTISATFAGLSGTEYEQAIKGALAQIGGYFDADSVKLYRLSLEGEVLKLRINWRTEGLAPPGEMPELLKRNYRGFAAHYSQGETIFFDSSHECPPWPGMRETMEFLGVKAGLGVPLEADDSGVDVFAMDKIEADYTWPVDILKHAEAIGRILLGAMRRSEAEVELHKSYDEIKQSKARLEQENIYLRKEMELLDSHEEIIGKGQAIKSALGQAEQVAGQETPVLILGETGTGKELLARAIHKLSPRKARTMIVINCAALSPTLIEGELFGREKGAYTGALTKQAGRFEIADKSTVFLDEIGDLPLELQAKLLRVLQEGQLERLGSSKTLTVDVRVVAATNQDLEEAVQEGRFRKDLFYRLSVFPITMPPLRERSDDIPLLTWFFVREFGERMGKTVEKLSKKSMDKMQAYSWPGNVRELRNVIERAMILHTGQTLRIDIVGKPKPEAVQPVSLEEVERNHITSILAKAKGKVSGKNGAAEMLGLKESTLRARMGKLGIRRKW